MGQSRAQVSAPTSTIRKAKTRRAGVPGRTPATSPARTPIVWSEPLYALATQWREDAERMRRYTSSVPLADDLDRRARELETALSQSGGKDLLTVVEASEATGKRPDTLRKQIRKGKLSALRNGGTYLIRRDDLIKEAA